MRSSHNFILTVSPSKFGGEAKNQDRASFDPRTQTACVCDGITSSPHAAKAAKIIAKAAPVILDDPEVHLKTAAEILNYHRGIALASPVQVSPSVPAAIRQLVQESARSALKTSFQTTMAALRCQTEGSYTAATMVSCGDSGLFAFMPSGQLLFTNLAERPRERECSTPNDRKTLSFRSGRELLVKPKGPLADYPVLSQCLKILTPQNWLLCQALRLFEKNEHSTLRNGGVMVDLFTDEWIAVPRYLFNPIKTGSHRGMGRVVCSRFVRRVCDPITDYAKLTFDLRGNTTAALPDAYSANQYDVFHERFPDNTHFLLCSDGFYRAFVTPAEMWQWLMDHHHQLTIRKHKIRLIDDLHRRLDQGCGDDDISFVWVLPPHDQEMKNAF